MEDYKNMNREELIKVLDEIKLELINTEDARNFCLNLADRFGVKI